MLQRDETLRDPNTDGGCGLLVDRIKQKDVIDFFDEVSHWKKGEKYIGNNKIDSKKTESTPEGYRNAILYGIYSNDHPIPEALDLELKKFIKGQLIVSILIL